ncbi:MAG: hypothetical protein JXA03_05145 [Bacteroidales bacterium]|nr:hypothetical protein [Bacteroidales bacterium]
MTKIPIRCLLYCFALLFTCAGRAQNKMAFLVDTKNISNDTELTAAFAFSGSLKGFSTEIVTFEEITGSSSLAGFDVIWYHEPDSGRLFKTGKAIDAVRSYYEGGGKVLLSGESVRWINLMKIEKNQVQARSKELKDEGYGRMAGFHGFREHPVFKGLNGGAYILKPPRDTIVRQLGFFGDRLPSQGDVVAVDWDYIFVKEDSRLILSYRSKEGILLAVGGYMCFSASNVNRKHLEKFTSNLFEWLHTGKPEGNHWSYGPQAVKEKTFSLHTVPYESPVPWNFGKELPEITKSEAGEEYWDVAGEGILVMGKQKGGIDEIWAHPFMAFRDIDAGISTGGSETVTWLKDLVPSLRITPAFFQRTYTLRGGTLTETVIADHQMATATLHYEYTGTKSATLFIRYGSNLRLMWPYSENVLKSLNFSFNKEINGITLADESLSYACIIGSNKPIEGHREGRFSAVTPKPRSGSPGEWQFAAEPSDEFMVKGCFMIALQEKDRADVIIAGSSLGMSNCVKSYGMVMKKADKAFDLTYYRHLNFMKNTLSLASPDVVFNQGFSWAMHAADRFFVHTPGLGASLTAGYATTASGWDGGHKINGRPGYAWYFGRDGVWSGLALLHYGDYEKVKSMLAFFNRFQDLNGKIFHEISTSGFVHYDAADATPLYIILAGRYLKHSGDIDFIRLTWPNIRAALDFCFSTDTDGDHLIENTNTGHGWVEGGSLFGSHTSLYLASCWAEALSEAAYIAKALRNGKDAAYYANESAKVDSIIGTDFYNAQTGSFYHGKFRDGSYHQEPTIMPAIPMLFGQPDRKQTGNVLDKLAGFGFSSDWGCRIVEESSPLFNPRGYHTGSVWPLFTGWASLAEYRYGNAIQGFTHLYNNLLIHRNWGLGFTEEVLNGEKYEPSGVCRHQCWSETMVIQPVIEGMLGLKPDAVRNYLGFAPQLPAGWDSIQVKNIRTGEHRIDFSMKRTADSIFYAFNHKGQGNLEIKFCPHKLPGMKLNHLHFAGDRIDTLVIPEDTLHFWIQKSIRLSYAYEGGISLLPLHYYPLPGDTTQGPRIISEEFEKNVYEAEVQGLQGTENVFELYSARPLSKLENCSIAGDYERINHLRVVFEASENKYVSKWIRIHFE